MTTLKKFLKSLHRKIKNVIEHFFCTWGCQKQARVYLQDHSGRQSMPDDASTTGLGAPEHEFVKSKTIEKLPRIPKIGSRDPGLNRAQRRYKIMTVLDSWTKFLNHHSKTFFITILKVIFTQSVYILCRNRKGKCAAASEYIFYVSANVWLLLGVFQCFLRNGRLLLKDINEQLLLKENVQLFRNICF